MESDDLLGLDHPMDLYLFQNGIQVFFRDVFYLNDFASVDGEVPNIYCLRNLDRLLEIGVFGHACDRIRCSGHSTLIFKPLLLLFHISLFVGLANFAVHADTKQLVQVH